MNNFSFLLRVYYEDTDAGGIVYYANYLKFLERARTEWLRQKGINQIEILEKYSLAFVVRSINLTYYKPAQLDDELIVTCLVKEVKKCSFLCLQEIKKKEEVVNRAKVLIVCVDKKKMRPAPFPISLKFN